MVHDAPDTCRNGIKESLLRFRMLVYSVFVLVVLTSVMGCTIPLRDMYTINADSVVHSQELANQLSGTWMLVYTAQLSGGDTLIDSASMAPRGLTTAEPMTEITLDTLQHFSINQYWLKCPYINWTGQYFITLDASNPLAKPYITFAEIRDSYNTRTGKTYSNTSAFCGLIKQIDDRVLEIVASDGRVWHYNRE